MDKQLLKDQLQGLEQKGLELREKETLFTKALGLDEQIEKARIKAGDLDETASGLKEELSELKEQKAASLQSTVEALTVKMNEVLPEGEAVFQINGGVFIGWKIDGVTKAYHGLSGGEKVVFDGALCHVLEADVLIYEAAECDAERLDRMLDQLSALPEAPQIIVNTWFEPQDDHGFEVHYL